MFDVEQIENLKRRLMIKVSVSQDELDGRPRVEGSHTHLSIQEIPNGEIPQLLVDLAS